MKVKISKSRKGVRMRLTSTRPGDGAKLMSLTQALAAPQGPPGPIPPTPIIDPAPIAPPPPTENARAGADEAEAIVQQVALEVMADWPTNVQPVLRMGVRDKVLLATRKAYASGRARGIEEGKLVGAAHEAQYRPDCGGEQFCSVCDELELDPPLHAIADAIAKEGT